jgi:myo-inositol catabolism protein IolC
VVHWLKTAASVPGFIGFAVGRTSFWSALIDFEAKRLSREEAVQHIGRHFTEWITSFEEARKA